MAKKQNQSAKDDTQTKIEPAKPGDVNLAPEVGGERDTSDGPEPIDLSEVDNQKDVILNDVAKGLIAKEHEKQRAADKLADTEDSPAGQAAAKAAKAEQNKLSKEEALLVHKGQVLTGGIVNRKVQKRVQELVEDPKGKKDAEGNVILVPKSYDNFPIKTINGEAVQFIASNPIWNKLNDWADGYNDYFHFEQCGHPMYDNSVCVEVLHENHDKIKQRGYVIKTDEEIQLFLVK